MFSEAPVMVLEECSVENTRINWFWAHPTESNVDCYILEMDVIERAADIHRERNFLKVGKGYTWEKRNACGMYSSVYNNNNNNNNNNYNNNMIIIIMIKIYYGIST